MRHENFILIDREPVAVSASEAARWWKNGANRRVAETQVGNVRVSTVFLCFDHNFRDEGPPILFETMAFADEDYSGSDERVGTLRCATWAEAEAQHAAAVARLRQ